MQTKLISIFLLLCMSCAAARINVPNNNINHTTEIESVRVDVNVPELSPLPEPERLVLNPPSDAGIMIQPLRRNQQAGFDGVLFSLPATAYLETEWNAVQQRCLINQRAETQRVVAHYQRNLEMLQVSMNSVQAQNRVLLNGRDREIQDLNNIIERQNRSMNLSPLYSGLLFGGGVLLGGVIVGSVAYVLSR